MGHDEVLGEAIQELHGYNPTISTGPNGEGRVLAASRRKPILKSEPYKPTHRADIPGDEPRPIPVEESLAWELNRHRYDTMSQDSGLQCVCGSDSRFNQDFGRDLSWDTFPHHLAQVTLRFLRERGVSV